MQENTLMSGLITPAPSAAGGGVYLIVNVQKPLHVTRCSHTLLLDR